MKPITIEEYKNVGEDFWPKYWYVSEKLGVNAKPEDILKVMDSLTGLVIKKRSEEKTGPWGFNKQISEK